MQTNENNETGFETHTKYINNKKKNGATLWARAHAYSLERTLLGLNYRSGQTKNYKK